MSKILIVILAFTSFSCFAFKGIYKFDLPAEIIEIQANADGSNTILKNPRDLFTVSSSLYTNKLDLTFSWMNDGSPELSRVILKRDSAGDIKIVDLYTIFNDGDPGLSTNREDVKLLSVVEN